MDLRIKQWVVLIAAVAIIATITDLSLAQSAMKNQPRVERDFVTAVLADTDNIWRGLFKEYGVAYEPPRMIIYVDQTISPCGDAHVQDGPFYCPANKTLYLDLAFLYKLKRARKLPGDFAVAYTITHEIGHHVQNEWGILAELGRMPELQNSDDYQVIPAKLETMADCLAGVWASKQEGTLSPQVIKAGIETASNIEKLYPPESKEGVVVAKPRSHGLTEDRIKWFTRGYAGGAMTSCNTLREE